MKLCLKDIQKVSENNLNNIIEKHWKIIGELSLSNEDSATINYWKTYGGVGTEYTNYNNNKPYTIKKSDSFLINIDALSSYSSFIPIKDQEFTIEIYFSNSKNLKRKYIFTYLIDQNDQFTLKDSKLHLLQ